MNFYKPRDFNPKLVVMIYAKLTFRVIFLIFRYN